MLARRPQVLCLSGLDPTGGAGIQADIEALAAAGAHALPLITALTAQDSDNVRQVQAVDADWLAMQYDVLQADCRIDAVKIGLLGSTAQIAVLAPRLAELGVPIVCDPVLRAGGGAELSSVALHTALRQHLLPQVTVLTPNAAEARRLVPDAADLAACAAALLGDGCAHVLITGGDEPEAEVCNRWYQPQAAVQDYRWPRLAETFHGAGCTLAAAIAGRLARGLPVAAALEQAQEWTQRCLQQAYAVGRGRRIPNRHRL